MADVRRNILLVALHVAFGALSLAVGVAYGSATLVVFSSGGCALAFVLAFGVRLLPGVFVGQLLVGLQSGVPLGLTAALAVLGVAEAYVALRLVRRLRLDLAMNTLRDLLGLVGLIFCVLQPLRATFAVALLAAYGQVGWNDYGHGWFAWWLGHSMGQLLIAPTLLGILRVLRTGRLHAVLPWLLLVLIFPAVWELFRAFGYSSVALTFAAAFPVLVAIGIQGGRAMAGLGALLIAVFVLAETRAGRGPFALGRVRQMLDLNLFILSSTLAALVVAVAFEHFKRVRVMLERYVGIIDQNVITATVDLEGRFVQVSRAMCAVSGYTAAELVGQPVSLVRHPETPAEVLRDMSEALATDEVWEGELQLIGKHGLDYWTRTAISPARDTYGLKVGYTSVAHDITGKKNVERLSITDQLTGIWNRRKLMDDLLQQLRQATRYEHPLSAIIIDIDHFKAVNDALGHAAGDAVLADIAQLCRRSVRCSDIVGRWGGEEFLVLCPETPLDSAVIVAEKLREAIASHRFVDQPSCTCSFGVAMLSPPESAEALLARADKALYAAKRLGRNRVERAEANPAGAPDGE